MEFLRVMMISYPLKKNVENGPSQPATLVDGDALPVEDAIARAFLSGQEMDSREESKEEVKTNVINDPNDKAKSIKWLKALGNMPWSGEHSGFC